MKKQTQTLIVATAIIALTAAAFVLVEPVQAQMRHITIRPPASNVIVPQSRARAFTPDRRGTVEITEISALIDILESTATTTIEIRLQNRSNRRQEAELIVPVPDGAVVRGFAYDGPHGKITEFATRRWWNSSATILSAQVSFLLRPEANKEYV
ncbi:MAG: VIT domain-containing protein [Planctomycetota bacterium]|jgi:hypothetical protein